MTPEFSEALAGLHARQHGRGWVARCPAHNDKAPSLRIDERDGKVALYCHAGCDTRDVLAAMGLSMSDLFDDDLNPSASGTDVERREVAAYSYDDADGNLLFQVVRFEPKGFTQRRVVDGEWVYSMEGVERVPYRLPEVIAADHVILVEGEKDADRLVREGFVATTSPSGAGKWKPEYSPWFAGKVVTILPDNDDAGRKHAESARAALTGVARKVRVVELPGLPPKGDVSDWFDQLHSADELRGLLTDYRALSYERMGDIEVRDDAPMAIEPYVLDEGPCILFGDGGSGKSTLALVLAASFASGTEIIPGSPPTASGPVMWLDYEAQRHTTAKRLAMLGHKDAPIFYVPGLRPIAEDVDRLRNIAEAEGIGLVVVDSVVLAVGGAVSPKDAEAPTQYANAVAAIAPRSIGLAHVVKSSEDDGRKPFGSGFWHNIARLTWHVKRDEEENGHLVRLTCRKRTNGEPFNQRTVLFDWSDGALVVGDGPAVTTVAGLAREVLLAEGPLSAAKLGAHMGGKSAPHITTEMKRHPDIFRQEFDKTTRLTLWHVVGDAL